MLIRLLPLMREVGLDAHWHVMEGGADFFGVTKAFHNALHGSRWQPSEHDFEIFRSTTGATGSACRWTDASW